MLPSQLGLCEHMIVYKKNSLEHSRRRNYLKLFLSQKTRHSRQASIEGHVEVNGHHFWSLGGIWETYQQVGYWVSQAQ